MTRPVIGISTYREDADWGSWRHVRADLMPADYADAVRRAGGIPLLLPPVLDGDDARTVASRIDGLILGGGADVDPARYRAQPHAQTAGWRTDRDASEFALLDGAAGAGVPTLGICRGMQMMAVHAGGTLAQHVPDVVGSHAHSPAPGVYGDVPVRTTAGTALSEILGGEVTVPCHHHQSVATHPGFTPVAHAADGLLEAMEDRSKPFFLAVQWHPEVGDDPRLFEALVVAAS